MRFRSRNFVVSLVVVLFIALTITLGYHDVEGNEAVQPHKEAAQAQAEIRVGTFSTAIDYAPYIVAKERRFFEDGLKDQNVKITYTTFETLPSINEAFAAGKLDMIFEAEPPVIVGRAAGIDIKVIGISCSLVQEILVPEKSSIKNVRDLKGKKIAVLAGTSSHYSLLNILKKNGVVEKDVKIIDMTPPNAKVAFESDQVDAWAVWPPFVEQEIVAKKGRVISSGNSYIYSIFAYKDTFLKEHADWAKKMVQAIGKAKEWIIANPEEAKKLVADALKLPLEVVDMAWPKNNWSAKLTPEVISDIQKKADFLADKQLIKKTVKVDTELFDLSYQ